MLLVLLLMIMCCCQYIFFLFLFGVSFKYSILYSLMNLSTAFTIDPKYESFGSSSLK